jgi:hypothetical protein
MIPVHCRGSCLLAAWIKPFLARSFSTQARYQPAERWRPFQPYLDSFATALDEQR